MSEQAIQAALDDLAAAYGMSRDQVRDYADRRDMPTIRGTRLG
jgi:hypothetical protein